jgi:hypothetical protein
MPENALISLIKFEDGSTVTWSTRWQVPIKCTCKPFRVNRFCAHCLQTKQWAISEPNHSSFRPPLGDLPPPPPLTRS